MAERFILDKLYFKEDDTHIVYMPALQLCGYGETEAKAEETLTFSFNELIRHTNEVGNLFKVLADLDWDMGDGCCIAPDVKTLAENDELLAEVLAANNYRLETTDIELPI